MNSKGFVPDVLEGKRILVTGGGSGLGAMMAEAFSGFGATVYICGRRQQLLEETAHAIVSRTGCDIRPLKCDIRSADEIDNMLDVIWNDGGALTSLVNNAAGNFLARTVDVSTRGFDAIASTVFHGTFYMTHGCGRRWVAAGVRASVVSIVVAWVRNGGPFTVPSAMSKAGITAMTKSLAVEWAPHGIRLNDISPGYFPTEGAMARLGPPSANSRPLERIPAGRYGEAQELTNLATFLLSDMADYLTGETIAIDGGLFLSTSGSYSGHLALSDEDWKAIREEIGRAEAEDKRRRTP